MSGGANAIDKSGMRGTRLAADQLHLALKNLRPNHWLMPIFAAVICAIFAEWVNASTLLLWWIAVAAGGAPLGYVSARFLDLPANRVPRCSWSKKATLAYFLFTATWSSMGFLFWRSGNDLNHMLILLLIACTLAGNSALVGASKPLAINGYAVYGLTLVILPLRESGTIYKGLSVLAFLYVCYLAYMSRQIYFTARDMLMLRDEKADLIEALAGSKRDSDLARQRAEAASRAKSQFLANMSHELRTPLNAILGFSELIQTEHVRDRPDKYLEYAKLIHGSGDHLLALINDILDLARIEAGKLDFRETDADLFLITADCLRLMDARAKANALAINNEVPSDFPLICADQRALKQILINLLSNALKFTPRDGTIRVSAGTGDGWVSLSISDTGVGIAGEDRDRVFQNFGQGRHDIANGDRGTGLGLPIVKGLVESHGGRVKLESELGQGTTVTILLPASRIRERKTNSIEDNIGTNKGDYR